MDLQVNSTSQLILSINKDIHSFLETLDNVKYFSRIFQNFAVWLHPRQNPPSGHISQHSQHVASFEGNHFYFTQILRK